MKNAPYVATGSGICFDGIEMKIRDSGYVFHLGGKAPPKITGTDISNVRTQTGDTSPEEDYMGTPTPPPPVPPAPRPR